MKNQRDHRPADASSEYFRFLPPSITANDDRRNDLRGGSRDGMQGRSVLYVPIALIVIVNSSHVARVAGSVCPTATGDDGKHRSARTDSAKRPWSSTGLIFASQGRKFDWESTLAEFPLRIRASILRFGSPRSWGNRLINTLPETLRSRANAGNICEIAKLLTRKYSKFQNTWGSSVLAEKLGKRV